MKTILFPFLVVLFTMTNPPVISETLCQDELRNLVESFLESYNRLEGIEIIGGPFLYKDYIQTVNKGCEEVIISFDYSRPTGDKGWPDSFKVVLYDDYVSHGAYNDEHLLEMMMSSEEKEVYYNQMDPNVFRDVHLVAVKQDNEISVSPFNPALYIKRIPLSRNREQVLVGPQYDSSMFFLYLGNSIFFVKDKNGNWKPPINPRSSQQVAEQRDSYLLFGNLNSNEIVKLSRAYENFLCDADILVVKVLADGISVYSGDCNVYCDWFFNRPMSSFVVQQDSSSFRIVREIKIDSVSPYKFGIPAFFYPLLDKPNDEKLNSIIKKAQIKSKLEDASLKQIIGYVCRFRDVGKNILSVEDVNEGPYPKIKVTTSSSFETISLSGESLVFEKKDGKWILVEFYKWMAD